ncbi:hypothetical protein PENTCL1PPCAC_24039, partial [Pristionchus entomophagus]
MHLKSRSFLLGLHDHLLISGPASSCSSCSTGDRCSRDVVLSTRRTVATAEREHDDGDNDEDDSETKGEYERDGRVVGAVAVRECGPHMVRAVGCLGQRRKEENEEEGEGEG